MKKTCDHCFWKKECEDITNRSKYDYDCWKYRNLKNIHNFSESSNRDDTENLHKR